MFDFLLPLWPFLIFFAWLFAGPHHGKRCPNCAAHLPGWQNPFTKTSRQWAEGGFVCRRCGCAVDIHGNKVAVGMPLPLPSSAARRGLLLMALILPAIISLTIIGWQSAAMIDPIPAPPVLAPVPPR